MARRIFSREFKVEAVRLAGERGVSVAQAARDLDIHENMLRRWAKELTADPGQAFPVMGSRARTARDRAVAARGGQAAGGAALQPSALRLQPGPHRQGLRPRSTRRGETNTLLSLSASMAPLLKMD
jgi:transposase-like protein